MHDPSTHREIVASVASLKSCLRSVVLAVSPPPASVQAETVDSKIQLSIQRATEAASNLERLLAAVADQTLCLPLETSKRLFDVGLPELLTSLLTACQPHASWPTRQPHADSAAPATAAESGCDSADDATQGTAGSAAGGSPSTAAAEVQQLPAIQHPSWVAGQQLISSVFSTLGLLTRVLIRACTRSADPCMVLLQLASPDTMQATVLFMQQLLQLYTAAADSQVANAGAHIDAANVSGLVSCVAAFSGGYSLLAAAVDVQSGLEELKQQLSSSLCSSSFMHVAAQLLLTVARIAQSLQQQQQRQQLPHQLEADCQNAGWSLLTVALFMSGCDITINPAAPSNIMLQPGQPLPSSVLAARIRLAATQQQQQGLAPSSQAAAAAGRTPAAAAAAALPLAAMQQQLLQQPVLAFLEERLHHCVVELSGSITTSSSGTSHQTQLLQQLGSTQQALLLPGRCCPTDQDALNAALRVLRCWRALLVSPAGPSLPLVSADGVQLLLQMLSGALTQPFRAASSEQEALRGRVIRVAVHCLQLLCSRLDQAVLGQQLESLTAGLAGVVSAAGTYWDGNKRAVKSEALPYTGQVRCVDKSMGDMMVRYTMAAQSALELLRELLAAFRGHQDEADAGLGLEERKVAAAMLSASLLPAIEQLFRQLPVVSPAHVAAADLLVDVLPLCINHSLSAGQLPLLATLRKFIIKSVGVHDPDRDAAVATATQLAALLGGLAGSFCGTSEGSSGGCGAEAPASAVLVQHAATHLLPALQVFTSALLKGHIPAPYSQATITGCISAAPCCTHIFPAMLVAYQKLAAVGKAAPQLQISQLLLSSKVVPTAADILNSNYWTLPQFVTANAVCAAGEVVSQPGGYSFSGSGFSSSKAWGGGSSIVDGQFAVAHVVQMLEDLLSPEELMANLAAATARQQQQQLIHASCSADCLCAIKRSEGGEACKVGNPKCGLEGWCCCSSPKACSDTTPPATPSMTAASASMDLLAGAATEAGSQQQQQLLLLTAALLQSKLLPDTLRALQQLSQAEAGLGLSDTGSSGLQMPNQESGGVLGRFSRPGSATGTAPLTVNVPTRKPGRDNGRVGGVSPRGHSPRGHSPPGTSPLASSLRSQSSGTQAYLTAYMGEPPTPATALGSSNPSLGLRLTATATSRFASSGSAATAAGCSPRSAPADDGAFGLLRAGSWASGIHWAGSGSGPAAPGLLQEAGVRMTRQSSSGFGSSPSLVSPLAGSCCEAGSPFLGATHDGAAAGGLIRASSGSTAAAAVGGNDSCCQLQRRLERVMMAVGQAILGLAAAGLLGEAHKSLSRRVSVASGDSGSGDSKLAGSGSLPKPALVNSSSGGSLTGYQQHLLLQARSSYSGSGPLGSTLGAEEALAGLRNCLAAAAAATNDFTATEGTCRFFGSVTLSEGGSVVRASSFGAGDNRDEGLSPSGYGGVAGDAAATAAVTGIAGESSTSDMLFPVDLGLSQLAITSPSAATAAQISPSMPVRGPSPLSAGFPKQQQQPFGTAAAAGGADRQAVPAELLKSLLSSLAACSQLLARYSTPIEGDLCSQLLMARLCPRPVGCWNPGCVNMPGVSETAVANKGCPSCKLATFCSKACEKAAWSEHTMACSRLAALAAQ